MYYNLFIVDLARFAMNPFLTVTMNGNGYFCYGVGYDNDVINLQLLMSQRFMDCAKTILKDLCDFSDSWTGYNAKYLDNCGYAENAEIKLYKYTLFKKNENKVLIGTANPKSAKSCFPLFVIP